MHIPSGAHRDLKIPIDMYISEQLLEPNERRLRLSTQLGVQHVAIDNRRSAAAPGTGRVAAWNSRELADYRRWIEGFDLKLDLFAMDIGSILLDLTTDPDGARRQRTVLADNIRKAADAGIDCLNYDLQLVDATRTGARPGRGGTQNAGFVHAEYLPAEVGDTGAARSLQAVSEDAAWHAIEFLVEGLVPAADAAGVRLACRPHDPAYPIGGLDGIEHVVGSADGMRQLLALSPSPNHGLDFCQGTVATMFSEPAKAMIPVIEEFAATGRIFQVHLGNIRGGYLDFQQVFPDEGDVDMLQAVKAYQRGGYGGPLCPGYLPASDLDTDHERFMAFGLGYTRGLLQAAGVQPTGARPAR